MASGGQPLADGSAVYARLWNPTVARFETALARLEHAPAAVAFSSGMAAMTAALLALTQAGRRHVVAVRPLYGGTDHLLASGLLGISTTFCGEDEVPGAIQWDTAVVIVETPAKPTLDLTDIAALVAQADGVPVLVDNTFAAPVLQNPVGLGARLVLHSATKYLRGPGAMISVLLRGGFEQARRLTDSVRLFTHAVSLGGVDSLVQHPAALTHRPVAAVARPSQGLIRFSIGLEDPGDLIADLDAALGKHDPSRIPGPRPATRKYSSVTPLGAGLARGSGWTTVLHRSEH